MLRLLRTSIVFRSVVIVLCVAMVIGSIFTAISYFRSAKSEHEQLSVRMQDLFNIVENTVSIACYLSDRSLANEVSQGMLSNGYIQHVIIRNGDRILADVSNLPTPASKINIKSVQSDWLPLRQEVMSPFNKKEKVCDITLEPNQQLLDEQVASKASAVSYLLLLQSLAMAITVVLVVLFMITRPIKKISDKLHHLPAETGARLPMPAGNEKDEIGQLVRDVNGLVNNLVRILDDERALRIQHEIGEKKYQAIFDNSETGIFVINDLGDVLSHNPAFLRMIGADPYVTDSSLNINLYSAWKNEPERLRAMIASAITENTVVSQDFVFNSDSSHAPRWLNLVLSFVEQGVLQGLINDITERKAAEESATQLAITDLLTGAFNRLGLDRELSRLLRDTSQRRETPFFMLLIDLDKFKEVNDTHGHDAGDIVLQYFTRLLNTTLRKTDFIARLGGDEFVVLLNGIREQDAAESIARKIIENLAEPIGIVGDIQVTIGASIGIAFSGAASFNKENLIKQADAAMYAAKKAGRNTFRVFNSD